MPGITIGGGDGGGGTGDHDTLINVSANDHHAQAHALTGGDHTAAGLTPGHVLTATGAASFAFQPNTGGGGGGSMVGYNVADYGAVGDGVTNDTAAIQAAINAASAAEGGVIWFPPLQYALTTGLTITALKRITLHGYGATLKPAPGITAIQIHQDDLGATWSIRIEGFNIDGGAKASNAIGIEIRDSDYAHLESLRIRNCGVGVDIVKDSMWVEGTTLCNVGVALSTVGIRTRSTTTGAFDSFGEIHLRQVGVGDCDTCILIQQYCYLYRSVFDSVTLWASIPNAVCLDVAGDVYGARWYLGLEQLPPGTGTTVGVKVRSTAQNMDKIVCQIVWNGSFSQAIDSSGGDALLFHNGEVHQLSHTNSSITRRDRYYADAQDRIRLGLGFAGGGGIELGAGGSTAPDVNWYRQAANVLRTDDVFRVGNFTTAGSPSASGQGGGLFYDTTLGQMRYSDGSAWQALGGGGSGGSAGSGGGGGGLVKLAETILSGSASDITITGIPAGYTHLLAFCAIRCDQAGTQQLNLQFNGDTSSIYDIQEGNFSNTTASAFQGLASSFARAGTVAGTTAPADVFHMSALQIPYYASTVFKKMIHGEVMRVDGTASGNIHRETLTGHWRSTAAITSIKLYPNAGSFVTGTRVTVYGLEAPVSTVGVYHNADQSIPDNTATALAFNTERTDVAVFHDTVTNNSRLTVPTAYNGRYSVGCNIAFAPDADGYRQVRLRKNGSTILASVGQPTAGATEETQINLAWEGDLAAADYLEIVVRHTAGAALNVVRAADYSPEFWLRRIS